MKVEIDKVTSDSEAERTKKAEEISAFFSILKRVLGEAKIHMQSISRYIEVFCESCIQKIEIA